MADPWRFGCPSEGHVGLRNRAWGGWYCQSCQQAFDALRDKKTGELTTNPGLLAGGA